MFDNVAFNVVLGLVFIYLLYSLFATVLSEIIATKLGLRARNLKEGIDRMLNDDKTADDGFFSRFWDSLKLTKNPTNGRIEKFYANPEIKYLGSSGIFKNPSSFKAVTFSRTLLYELNGGAPPDMNFIRQELLHCINPAQNPSPVIQGTTPPIASHIPALDKQSADFVLSLLNDSYGDLVKFKLLLEGWFDRTMEQTTEWYKRKIQIVLLVLGFFLAWFFNADTFTIISKLSTDRDAREKIVTLAAAYSNANPAAPGGPALSFSKERLDSLIEVKNKLDQDIANANTILGAGGWAPDSVKVTTDPKTHEKIFIPQIDYTSLSKADKEEIKEKDETILYFTHCEKWGYFFRLFCHHFFGFLITAIAISLGAPFWFDLLNKLMKLRTSQKESTDTTAAAGGNVSPLKREA